MKYLVKDEDYNNNIIISGETKKEIIIKVLQKYLTDEWADDLMETLENNCYLTFIDLTNIEEL